ncbi:hypothetical protein BD769DRAFT_1780283 [Suillus cothurnatus]|nr:hypothetical protein BD769DRAFT_1780283 [Suillus cothurnatus]
MNAALETGYDSRVYTQSPSIIATSALYDDPTEFDRIANLIANDLHTLVVYVESLALAEDLVEYAFTGERKK